MNEQSASEWLTEGERHRSSGDEAAALEAFQRAAQLARQVFDPAVVAQASLAIGELKLLAEDFRGAREAFDEAIGRAMEGGVPLVEADAWFALATACFDAGLSKDGHDAVLESMALYRELADASPQDSKLKRRLARSIRIYGEHLGVLGSESDARQALELARIMYQDLGEAETARGIAEEIQLLKEYAR